MPRAALLTFIGKPDANTIHRVDRTAELPGLAMAA
jgi:hypothetical protein